MRPSAYVTDPLPIEPLTRPFDVTITPPGSKSITCRAYVLAALAQGESKLIRPLRADDTDRLLEALCTLGADARWEGNVRQLRNVLERVCMLATGEFITEKDLAGLMHPVTPAPAPAPRTEFPAPLMEIEREHIVKTLEQVRGNKAVAARLLGISRRAFYRQLERHGLHQRVPMTSSRSEASPSS